MGPLRRAAALAAAAALLAATPLGASPRLEQWRSHVEEASRRFGIPEAWIFRVMRAESGGRTHLGGRPITSRAGAMGLMQVMPGTWREMARAHGLGRDPHAPRDNILAGAAYLRSMYDRFGHPGLFAAYNAGPARYEQHLRARRPLPAETRAYLAQVAGPAADPRPSIAARTAQPTADGLFFTREATASVALEPQPAAPGGLFAVRRTAPAAPR